MRLAVLHPDRTSQGGTYFLENLSAAIARTGAELECVPVYTSGEQAPGRAVWRSVGNASVRAGSGLDRILGTAGADALLCAGSFVPAVSLPTIFWPLTVGPLESAARRVMAPTAVRKMKQRSLQIGLSLAVRRADAYVFSSHYAKGLYSGAFGKPTVAPAAVIHPARPDLDHRWRENGQTDVLFASRVNHYKRLPTVIRAFGATTAPTETDARLRVAGEIRTEASSAVDAAIAEVGRDAIDLLGELDRGDLYREYLASACFVFSSLSENAASYALIDAMAMGVPCVSSTDSSVPEIAADGVRYVRPFDAPSLAAALDEVLGSRDRREELSIRAHDAASRLPDWDQVARHFTEFALNL